MIEITLAHYLFLSAVIFTLGVFGIFVNRKNVIVILMSIELILLSVNINMVAFSVYLQNITGQIFTLFILTVAAAEATDMGSHDPVDVKVVGQLYGRLEKA